MNIKRFELGMLGTNCYLLEMGQHALVVDPGGDAEVLIHYFNEHHLDPIAILLTHAHFDHIGAVEDIRTKYNIPVYMHSEEREWLTKSSLNGSQRFGVGEIYSHKPAEHFLNEGTFTLDNFTFHVLHTPGHSPGSLSFWFEDEKILIAGDTLFNGSIGRTDLPFGKYDQLIKNINEKILVLPNQTIVYPGHGPSTTVGDEKLTNPFLN